MKVLLLNGSPKEKGCTYTALCEIEKELQKEGIETQIFHAGKATMGCVGCGYCAKEHKCITNDCLNEAVKLLDETDAIVIGSPVHFAGASGAITGFMDRLFMVGGSKLTQKPCAVIASCRRGGSTSAIDQLLKYPEYNQMPIINGQYWSMVHGNTPQEVMQDKEGMQVMRTIGKNMAWILKCIDLGRKNNITAPKTEPKEKTNYIR